jgi:hypothetical protein
MGKWMEGRQVVLRDKGHEIEFPESREPGDPIRQIGFVNIDRSVFQHSKKECELLKLAKAQEKLEALKR